MKDKELIQEIVKLIITLKDDDLAVLKVKQLSEDFKVHRSTLTKKFKSIREIPLGAYILQEKMFRAAFLLSTEEKICINQLAKRLGFCTYSYFIQVFEKHHGITPSKYRKYRSLQLEEDSSIN